jgi:putative oxidoreductase
MSDIAYALGRILLPLVFIISGWAKLMDVSGVAGTLGRAGFPQPRMFGYAVAALELVGGLMVLVGFRARWAALALFFFTAGTIYISHAFWTFEGAQYIAQRSQAFKNLAIMGGLLLIFANGSGRLSIDGRR